MKAEIRNEPFELNIKRCYLPVKLIDECPQCGAVCERDLKDWYLSYPVLNEPFTEYMTHYDCPKSTSWGETTWEVEIVLEMKFSFNKPGNTHR